MDKGYKSIHKLHSDFTSWLFCMSGYGPNNQQSGKLGLLYLPLHVV